MTLRYLLDTNIISEPVRPIPNANVMTKLIGSALKERIRVRYD